MLSTNKEEQLKDMPNIQTSIKKSGDGRYIIHKTVITDVKPAGYYETILASALEEI
tara:strand:- start:178 stop:345 length:168 start_codon:yes stop_codon:yes gene_type:complete